MTLKPTHLDETGAAHMVDVGTKPATQRRAVASGRITMAAEALEAMPNSMAASRATSAKRFMFFLLLL